MEANIRVLYFAAAAEAAGTMEELFTAALGRGLLRLPKFALPEAAEER